MRDSRWRSRPFSVCWRGLVTTDTPSRTGFDDLRSRVRGTLITPVSDEYESARRVWTASVDCRPGAVLRCVDAQDVAAGIHHAREHGLLLAVRGGGHDVAGYGTADDG